MSATEVGQSQGVIREGARGGAEMLQRRLHLAELEAGSAGDPEQDGIRASSQRGLGDLRRPLESTDAGVELGQGPFRPQVAASTHGLGL